MTNRLATEPSPYLQQHAGNPVDWYPWGEEALDRARREDRPILLSIGYSACHWCHVMAHDCFEDDEVAAVMNRLFVNIKVDREERPDLDQIYQTAHQLLTQRGGGWPLTVFLAPDQTPFFAGTYFPRTSRYQLPGFIDLMENVARAWHERRNDVLALMMFSLSVVSLPMMLHRKVDFATALVTSFMATRLNFMVMLVWGAVIAALIAVGMATNFIAMTVIFPWLGHASWHAYRDLIERE